MCLTPSVASVLMSVLGLSFRWGIIGSILTQTGMSFWVSVCIACSLCMGVGAFGSSCLASWALSVVMVRVTAELVSCRTSVSRVTRFDFVMIWILQLCWDRIFRHFRVKPVSFSIVGYGSLELAMEISSPLRFCASFCSLVVMFFLGLQWLKFGM